MTSSSNEGLGGEKGAANNTEETGTGQFGLNPNEPISSGMNGASATFELGPAPDQGFAPPEVPLSFSKEVLDKAVVEERPSQGYASPFITDRRSRDWNWWDSFKRDVKDFLHDTRAEIAISWANFKRWLKDDGVFKLWNSTWDRHPKKCVAAILVPFFIILYWLPSWLPIELVPGKTYYTTVGGKEVSFVVKPGGDKDVNFSTGKSYEGIGNVGGHGSRNGGHIYLEVEYYNDYSTFRWSKVYGGKITRRSGWFWKTLVFENGEIPNESEILTKARREVDKSRSNQEM